MLNWLKTNATAARDKMKTEVAKYRNADFMEAIVAGCALVAAADGKVTSDEKQKMAAFIQRSDELSVFDMAMVIEAFNKIMEGFEFDAAIGKIEAMKKITRLRGKDEEARTMVRVCCVIGAADGDFDADERKVVAEICTELGLSPSEFDL